MNNLNSGEEIVCTICAYDFRNDNKPYFSPIAFANKDTYLRLDLSTIIDYLKDVMGGEDLTRDDDANKIGILITLGEQQIKFKNQEELLEDAYK